MSQDTASPAAQILISTGCPHCEQVLRGLQDLIKKGVIARLEIINLTVSPQTGLDRGIKSVPWTQIGPFIIEGLHTPAELRHWALMAQSPDGMAWYFDEQLKTGKLNRVESMVREEPSRLQAVVKLAADSNTAMQTRVGIGALLENLEGSGLAPILSAPLSKLLQHPDARVRADACHYLSLTEDPAGIPLLQSSLEDKDPIVREIAEEGIDHLNQRLDSPASDEADHV